jgi:hypothetical protein
MSTALLWALPAVVAAALAIALGIVTSYVTQKPKPENRRRLIAAFVAIVAVYLIFVGVDKVHDLSPTSGETTGTPTAGSQSPDSPIPTPSPTPTTPSPSPSPTITTSSPTTSPPPPPTYLSSLDNLTGDYVNSPVDLNIGKNNYANSLEVACINFEGGGRAQYDVSAFHELKATLGIPSDDDSVGSSTCAVTITDQSGKALAPVYHLSAGSTPVALDIALANVTQLNIKCVFEYPSSQGSKHGYVALGDPLLT